MNNLHPQVRRRVAALAADLYAGRVAYAEFVVALPPLDLSVDDAVTELVGLIEHEPARGGVLGVSAAAHTAYVADIRRRIAELAA